MELTKETFRLYAIQHYDNPSCLSEDEFNCDLNQLVTIRRMMTWYLNGKESNLRLLVNNIIIFYNCFEHHAATKMLQFNIDDSQIDYLNAILSFLSLPMLIPPEKINREFYEKLENEFR